MKKGERSIIFINQSSGYLMIDIIHQHLKSYDKVILFTGFLNPRNTSLDRSVKVHMLKSYNRNSTLLRLSSWMVFTVQCWWLLLVKYRKSTLYCVSNPPFTIWFGLFLKRPIAFLVYDVYPDVLVSTNMISKNHVLVKLWKKWNIGAYRKASQVFTIGKGMRRLLSNYTVKEKVEVVPIWTDNTFLKPIPKSENRLVKEWNLTNKFVVMYSGNLGRTHPVELLVHLAYELKALPIEILIIGEGEKKEEIRSLLEQYDLSNVQLLPYQATELLPYSLTVADLAVVTLANEAGQLSVPSKTFNLMSCGLPIMSIAPQSSELSHLLSKYDNGKCFNETQFLEMKEFVIALIQDSELRKTYADKSLQASKDFTPLNAKKMYFDV